MNGSSCRPQGALPFAMPERSERASQHQMQAFFDNLVRELDQVEFLRPAEKRETMLVNLRNIFTRMEPTKQDMHTLHGVVMAIAEGRKGPAKGGVLDGEQATRLRALLAEHGQGALPSESGTRARAGAAAAAKSDRRRADPVAGADHRSPLRRAIQAPDAGRPAHSGFRLVRAPDRDRTDQSATRPMSSSSDRAARQAWLEAARLPGAHHGGRRGRGAIWPPNSIGSPPNSPNPLKAGAYPADLACSLRSDRLQSMKCQGDSP